MARSLDDVALAIRAAAAAWRGGPDEEYYRRLAEAAVDCLDLPVVKGGTILTDKVIERLSAEAEAGYDVDRLRPTPCPCGCNLGRVYPGCDADEPPCAECRDGHA